ncbi:VWA domain-containing protein [Micromonospora sp. CP22]|uniref:vWA domain-containing protein n=1 Tax=Micromonospora sp. CP22 TaxID=2580517 RepID=UPI0012BC3D49|nr:VWA domain-containing protein [Micromonospora sp. CP22]MTK04224.1 VWA domain-containing protein [Micromonospora sp. CP22]
MNPFALFQDESEEPDAIPFVTDTHRRRFVALLIDTSWSMAATQSNGMRAIDVLNQELTRWLPTVRAEGRGALRDVEFVVVTFGAGGVRVVSGDGTASAADGAAFVPASRLDLPTLTAGGATPMVAAVELALDLVEQRRQHVQTVHAQQTGGPRLILVSDGTPTDDEGNPTDDWRPLARRLEQWRSTRRLQMFAFGVPGVDDEVMRALATPSGYFALADLDLRKLLDLILVATSDHVDFDQVRSQVYGDDL